MSHIYKKCKDTVEHYNMIEPGDRVAVEFTWDCNTVTLLTFLLKYQLDRNFDFDVELFIEAKDGKIDERVEKVLDYVGITEYHKIEAAHKQEVYESMKVAKCNRMALHQTYNFIVKAAFMKFMRKKKGISPVIDLGDYGITMIRPMLMIKDSHITHWISKIGVDVRLGDEVTLFGSASISEEGIEEKGLHSSAEYQFNVYERA